MTVTTALLLIVIVTLLLLVLLQHWHLGLLRTAHAELRALHTKHAQLLKQSREMSAIVGESRGRQQLLAVVTDLLAREVPLAHWDAALEEQLQTLHAAAVLRMDALPVEA